jgi:predicted  nucleic acid-binding Zn-ribbon protein
VAVEDLARGQSQAQALAVYLSAQQARVQQATQLLDAARKELDSATARSRDVEAQVARFSESLSGTTDRQERAALEDALRAHQAEASAADLALQRARTREGDLSLALSREEHRWGDLIARLEALTR